MNIIIIIPFFLFLNEPCLSCVDTTREEKVFRFFILYKQSPEPHRSIFLLLHKDIWGFLLELTKESVSDENPPLALSFLFFPHSFIQYKIPI